jgi:predicted MFS family arabinose efflux permease
VTDAIGIKTVYWIFGGIGLIGIVLLFFFLPETKGKSLREITAGSDYD